MKSLWNAFKAKFAKIMSSPHDCVSLLITIACADVLMWVLHHFMPWPPFECFGIIGACVFFIVFLCAIKVNCSKY